MSNSAAINEMRRALSWLPGAIPHAKSFISRVAFRLMNTPFNY